MRRTLTYNGPPVRLNTAGYDIEAAAYDLTWPDAMAYGTGVARLHPDGTMTRLDPRGPLPGGNAGAVGSRPT